MNADTEQQQQFKRKANTAARGQIVSATVKEEVHDIGNLANSIVDNNHDQVMNRKPGSSRSASTVFS